MLNSYRSARNRRGRQTALFDRTGQRLHQGEHRTHRSLALTQNHNKHLFDRQKAIAAENEKLAAENNTLEKRNLDLEHGINLIKQKCRTQILNSEELQSKLNLETAKNQQLAEAFKKLLAENSDISKELAETKKLYKYAVE